jgi:YidC/Oxa1 family membrane protein insertase
VIFTYLIVGAHTPSFLKPIGKVFEPIVKLLHYVLVLFHNGAAHLTAGAAWGLAIIGLTILVRLILMPLTFRQFRSAQSMAALQPHIKELQRKYKGDKQKLQQETMRLYQANKVNPFASCLPLVLQIPIFISLYWAIRGASYLNPASTKALHDASFLWLNHLGKPDPTYILLILYVVSQLVSTELMMTPTTDKQQKWLMRAMPIFFIFILRNFPSGLFLYWVTTNLWTIGQQIIIRRKMPHDVAVANVTLPKEGEVAAVNARSGQKPKKQGRFMQAIMAAQEERERRAGGQKKQPGKPGARPAGKPGARPAGKTSSRPAGKPGSRPAGKPGTSGNKSSGGGRPSGKRPAGKKPGQRPSP